MKSGLILPRAAAVMSVLLILCAGCGSRETATETDLVSDGEMITEKAEDIRNGEIHVSPSGSDESGDGSERAPFATVTRAAAEAPGSVIIVHEGIYGPIELGPGCSGTGGSVTVIRPADGEKAVIRPDKGVGLRILNASYLMIDGLTVEGGTHGIYYESTREAGSAALENVTIRNCEVSGIRGVHGICVYARNDLAPVSGLTIEGCHVYDCECGSSESVVINGNIDGFLISSNVIHDNNNIGIDMIGFEGTARHPEGYGGANPYEYDMARNGICRDNIVYGISADGNMAYFRSGGYDLCADGIYVDGGQNIEICGNFIFCCDIGLEVATEHSPDDNELFRVSGIEVHDNVIAGCRGWAGLCFGGYAHDLGFTENCEFRNNTLIGNAAQIAVQRSRNNRVYSNLIAGGDSGVEFNYDCAEEDMVNDISGNVAAGIGDEDSWREEYGGLYKDSAEIIDGFRPLKDGFGAGFAPDERYMEIYKERSER